MNAGRFFTLVAERAVAAGRPLHDELQAAAAIAGSQFSATRAIDFARAGKLGEALGALAPLGFDPLLAEAAALRPEAASEIREALARVPRFQDLARPLIPQVIYLSLVLLLEAVVALFLGAKLLPVLGAIVPAASGLLTLASLAGTLAFLFALLAAVSLPLALRLRAGRRLLLGPLSSARLCAAFAPLTAAGVPVEVAFTLAKRHAPALAGDFEHLRQAALNWHELSLHFSERGEARVARLCVAVRVLGTALAVLLAALVVSSVYLTLPYLSAWGGTP